MFSNALHEDLMRLGLVPDRSLKNVRKMEPKLESNRKVLKATRIVRFPEFYEKAARVFASIADAMSTPKYKQTVLFIQPKKSNAWMAVLFLDFLERAGMRNLIRNILLSDLSDETEPIANANVVFLDDGTYSGTQMVDFLAEYVHQLSKSRVIVGIPFATSIAIDKIREELEMHSGRTPSMIFYTDIMEPLGKTPAERKPAVYFDHKVPNSVSTYAAYDRYLDPAVTRPFYKSVDWFDWMDQIEQSKTRIKVKLDASTIPRAHVVNIKCDRFLNRKIVTYDNL